AAAPDGRTIATAGYHTIALWDIADGRRRQTLHLGGDVYPSPLALAFGPDGTSVAAICSDQTLRLWDLAKDGERLRIDLKSRGKAQSQRAFAFLRFAAGRGLLVKDF